MRANEQYLSLQTRATSFNVAFSRSTHFLENAYTIWFLEAIMSGTLLSDFFLCKSAMVI